MPTALVRLSIKFCAVVPLHVEQRAKLVTIGIEVERTHLATRLREHDTLRVFPIANGSLPECSIFSEVVPTGCNFDGSGFRFL